ncbi:ABC transporter permease subunit [Maridesulfovibrio sp.]|uniref:ABC transporter permease n=1 Tax=Maridesulfovibrio sp. TaxID=2795000 RepID=UPI002A186D61|nr:ABC transporter permease subunit [Maridesulfovibrio sp.]
MDFELMMKSIPKLLAATELTLLLVGLTLVLGLALSLVVAFLRVSRKKYFRWPAYAYIFFFRGSPLLVQLFLIYYGLPQLECVRDSFIWPLLRQPLLCALLAFCLNTAAYTGELLRGAIEAVPAGQIEAGMCLGMSRWQIFRKIVLPQAIRIGLPAYSNEVVYTIKDSSLASVVTLLELTGMARNIVARTYKPIEIFLLTACIYLILVFVATRLLRMVEGLLPPHDKKSDRLGLS